MPPDEPDSLLRWIGLIWLTVLGGCVGSFLNVVIYRLPRGQSLSYPPSRCPHCEHAIRWYHNVPVVGWLVLRGRCHDCRAPIAVRYPLVEFTVAAVFLLLAASGPLAASVWSAASADGSVVAPVRSYWIAYAWEAVLLCTLLALGLIDRDLAATGEGRYPFPWMAVVFSMAVVLPILLPEMLVYTGGEATPAGQPPTLRHTVHHVGLGGLAGCGCGCLMFAASRGGPAALRQSALPALVGPYIGPWPILELVSGTLLLHALQMFALRAKTGQVKYWLSWPLLFFLATFGGIVLAHQRGDWIVLLNSPPLGWRMAIAGGLLIALLAYALAARMPRCRPE